ncbi:MAG: glucose-6-phosphate isomerase [bacterium]
MNYSVKLELGSYKDQVQSAVDILQKREAARKIWLQDPTLWKSDEESVKSISNRLGWLNLGAVMKNRLPELIEFAQEIKGEGFTDVLLLGMGGSSLCPEVLTRTFGSAPGFPKLHVLDSTVPAQVTDFESRVDLAHTLVVVPCKSGGTVEPNSLMSYFYEKIKDIKGDQVGNSFVAITDPGTSMVDTAQANGFRRVFLTPPEVGGRFSAFTYFGMLPGALIGARIGALLENGGEMATLCSESRIDNNNLGIKLGAAIGALALEGLDKLTFITSPGIESFGDWVEQLIAESTGKEGKGILPVVGEPLGEPDDYGQDRVFVYLKLKEAKAEALEAKLKVLLEAGYPLITCELEDTLDLGAQFFLWEFATSMAGVVLDINPFSEPNVKESKDITLSLIKKYQSTGNAPEAPAGTIDTDWPVEDIYQALTTLMAKVNPGDYIALNAFIEHTEETEEKLQSIRAKLMKALKVATTLGYGPRFLHSTGQYHKGGPNKGLFIEFFAKDLEPLPIPGQEFSFCILKQAQALGDFETLRKHNRRAMLVNLKSDVIGGLQKLVDAAITIK